MNLVKFPGLGLQFNISKYVLKIGNIYIYKYAVCIVLAIVVGMILSKKSKIKFGINYDFVLEILIGAIIFGFLGARIYYIIFNINKYVLNPQKIFNIRDGGLAIYGGIIGVVIFLYFKCKKNKIDFLDVCDYLVPYLAIGQAIGRWGNFFNKEAYGSVTGNIFRMGIEVNGAYTEVHPVFLYESISTFIIFIILKIMQKNRKFKGQILYAYLCFYSFIRMFLEGLRVDSLMIGILRVSQVLSLVIFVVFSIFYLKNSIKNSKK